MTKFNLSLSHLRLTEKKFSLMQDYHRRLHTLFSVVVLLIISRILAFVFVLLSLWNFIALKVIERVPFSMASHFSVTSS
ncbi:hypothetical protein L596_021534 [Steinernema carpocapsae]|uniref:Uncharacterized protein n=1 Tax=Steinernema carpocapsae TaxID=34508 RepID=A0A4U5MJ41_STECR|nr:hypothetical protein L596_021534 [Steinernema carpocapsae]